VLKQKAPARTLHNFAIDGSCMITRPVFQPRSAHAGQCAPERDTAFPQQINGEGIGLE
jgi:hypothetical protein